MTITYLEPAKATYKDAQLRVTVNDIANECRERGATWKQIAEFLNFLQVEPAKAERWNESTLRSYLT